MPAAPVNPVLVFTWGNASRGDDGLGPALFELLEAKQLAGALPGVDLLTDYQLQVEHALDLQGRSHVLFIDASMSAPAPYELRSLQPEHDASYTTHAMSPGAVLKVFEQINRQVPPPAFMLSICGYEFGLGKELSSQARANLQDSYTLVCDLLTAVPVNDWDQYVAQAAS